MYATNTSANEFSGMFISVRQLSNIVFPDIMTRGSTDTNLPQSSIYEETNSPSENKQRLEYLKQILNFHKSEGDIIEAIRHYSEKFMDITQQIIYCEGTSFVFSEYKQVDEID